MAVREYISNLDLGGNEIKDVVIDKVSEMPATATQGRFIYFAGTDATGTYHTGSLYIGNGTAWVELAQGGDTTALASRISALEETVGDNTKGLVLKVSDLEALVGASDEVGLRKKIADNTAAITTLEGVVGETETAGLQGRVKTAEGDIDTLEGLVGKTTDEKSASGSLYARVAQNTYDISTNKTAFDNFTAKLETTVTATADDKFPTSKAVATLVNAKIASVLRYKGAKTAVAEVKALTGMVTGDVWHVTADGSEWAYDGTTWQELGTATDLSGYATKTYVDTQDALCVPKTTTVNGHALSDNVTVTKDDVGLGNVSNLAPADLPISTATQTALDKKVDKLTTAPTTGTYCKVTIDSQGLVKSGDATKLTVDDISDISSKYLGINGTAKKATQLETARSISITGGATASAVSFDGTGNVALSVTSLDASKVTGTLSADVIPSLDPSKISGTIPEDKMPFKRRSTTITNVATITLDVAIPYGLLVVDSNQREVFCEVIMGSGDGKATLNFSKAFTGVAYYIG